MVSTISGNCFTLVAPSRSTPSVNGNPDLDSFIVVISSIVVNSCIPILFVYSDEGIETSIFMLFSQAYPTLLATYFSIQQGQLNVVDSRIAVIITSSPVCMYLLYSALLDLVRRPNEFFKRIKTSKLTIKILSLLLLVLWFSLTLIVSFSSTAFVDSDQCKKGKFSAWLQLILASLSALLLFWTQIPILIISLQYAWLHRKEIHKERVRVKKNMPRLFFRILTFYRPIRDVVLREHPWLLVLCFLSSYAIWIFILTNTWIPVLSFGPPTFGQILTLFTMVPPLNSVLDISYKRRHDLRTFLCTYPQYLRLGIIFFFTGHRSPNSQSKGIHELLLSSEVEIPEGSLPPSTPAPDQINHSTTNTHAHEMPSVQLKPTLGAHSRWMTV